MRTHYYSKHSYKQGFSVVELLIVILVIGILAGIAGVSVSKYQRSVEADVAASDLSQLIRRTRENALSERATYRIRLQKNSLIANIRGDTYTAEKWTYNSTTGISSITSTQTSYLPKGWRFGRLPGDAAPTPRGLSEVSFNGNDCYIIFKGDGSMGNGNSPTLLTTPTSNINIPPMNGNIFIYDSEEGDSVAKRYKPRSIIVLGSTGRTAIWKLFDTEWRFPGQI